MSVVAGALERCPDCARFQFEQLLVIYREWFFDFALHMQPPRIPINRRDRKVRSNVKRFDRRDVSLEPLGRHLEIERVFTAHNSPAAKLCFVLLHRLPGSFIWTLNPKSTIRNFKSKIGSIELPSRDDVIAASAVVVRIFSARGTPGVGLHGHTSANPIQTTRSLSR